MKYIYGILDFENNFLFQNDILGNCIKANINGIETELYFPKINPNIDEEIKSQKSLLSKQLISPNVSISNLNPDLDWGYLRSYPDIIAEVNKIIISFPEGNEDKICEYIEEWLNLLFKYCKLISRIIVFHDNPNKIIIGGPLRLFSLEKNKLIKIDRAYKSHPLTVYLLNKKNAISLNQLNLAIELASGRKINLEDELILNSYYELEKNNYRKCVIEAGSALEILLTKVIIEEFDKQDIHFGEKLLNKYQTLRGRFELLDVLEIPIPTTDYQNKIIKQRNIAVHGANPLNKEIAKTFIAEVQKYFDVFSPLE